MQKENIKFGSNIINFNIVFKARKTLGIFVKPDQTVLVKAPIGADLSKIREKLIKRAPWILKQQSYFLSFHPLTPPRKYISGETHLYLGRQYRLKIIESKQNQVKLKRGFLEVHTQHKGDTAYIKKQVNEWYKIHAKMKLTEYAETWIKIFKKYNAIPLKIEIRSMPKRWGSCSPNARILLNLELIKAPKGCIEYVIVHEFCHLIYPNHTRAFINLLTKQMPDWEKWKDRLEQFLA